MRESLATTAQYTLNASADAGGLLRCAPGSRHRSGSPDININDLVTFCAIRRWLQVPDLNAEFIDGQIHKHTEVHHRVRLRHAARADGAGGARCPPLPSEDFRRA